MTGGRAGRDRGCVVKSKGGVEVKWTAVFFEC